MADRLRSMTAKRTVGRVFEANVGLHSRNPSRDLGIEVKDDKLLAKFNEALESKDLELENLRREMWQRESATKQRTEIAIAQHEAQSRASLQEANVAYENLKQQFVQFKTQHEQYHSDLEAQVQKQEEEISDLKLELHQAKVKLKKAGTPRKLARLSAEISRLAPEKQELEKENDQLRTKVGAIPILEQQVDLFREKATAAEFAVGELQLAVTLQEQEINSLRQQLEEAADPFEGRGRRPTPQGEPQGITNLEELLLSPMQSPAGSINEPSLGDQMEFLDLSQESIHVERDESEIGTNERLQELEAELLEKNETLDEKQKVIEHLEESLAAMVTHSHRTQRDVEDLRQQLQTMEHQKQQNGSKTPKSTKVTSKARRNSPTYIIIEPKFADAVSEVSKKEGPDLTYLSLRAAVSAILERGLSEYEKIYVRGFSEASTGRDGRELVRLRHSNATLREELDAATAKADAAGTPFGSAPVLIDGNLFVPDGVTVDGYQGNSAVRRVTMGCHVGVTAYSFLNCPNLESIVGGSHIVLGSSNFADCPKLASVTFGEQLRCSDGSFQGCSVLKSVSLGPAATLGHNLPERFYQAASGKVMVGTAAAPSVNTETTSNTQGKEDVDALKSKISSLTREVDFLSQGIAVKDEQLASIERDARQALMPSLTKELELSKLGAARLRWQIALLTSRCRSLKDAALNNDSRTEELTAEVSQLRAELAKSLKVIQSCPAAKMLAKERKRREKKKARKLKSPRRSKKHQQHDHAAKAASAATTVVVAGADAKAAAEQPAPAKEPTPKKERFYKFLRYMRETEKRADFADYFDAAFDCLEDVVKMRGKSSYGYQYQYEGQVNGNGKPHGIGRAVFDIKKHGVYIGEFVDGLFHGKGSRQQPQGCYTGSWARGKLHGHGTLLKADGTMGFSGEWANSKPVVGKPAQRK